MIVNHFQRLKSRTMDLVYIVPIPIKKLYMYNTNRVYKMQLDFKRLRKFVNSKTAVNVTALNRPCLDNCNQTPRPNKGPKTDLVLFQYYPTVNRSGTITSTCIILIRIRMFTCS